MPCRYSFNGVKSPELDGVLNYIQESAPGTRTPLELMQKFEQTGLVEFDPNIGSYVTLAKEAGEEAMKVIESINGMTIDVFKGGKPLFLTERLGNLNRVRVSEPVLNRMEITDEDFINTETNDSNNTPLDTPAAEEGVVEDDTTELEEENNDVRESGDLVTNRIIANIEYEISRIGRIPETERTRNQIAELKVLQRNLKKVKQTHQKVSDYFDFVDYVAQIAKKGNKLINRIEKDVEKVDQMTDQEKLRTLQDISDLKESIDSFYNQEDKKSVLALLETKLLREGVQGTAKEKSFLLEKLQEAVVGMRAVNNQYLDSAIPVLTRTLHSFAPIEINQQLDAQIKNLKENMDKGIYLTSGLSRLDKRFITARVKGRKAVTELNIKQLEQKKIGIKEIENELRETHNKVSWFSMWTDPAVYSSDTITKLVAQAVRDKLLQSNDESIALKYGLREPFRKYRDYMKGRGVSEDRPDLFYQPMYEVVQRPMFNPETKKTELKEVVQFVQPENMNKFYKNRSAAYEKFREQYKYPTDPTLLDEYFEGPLGKAYLEATAEWYYNNTEKIEGAEVIERDFIRRRISLFQQINDPNTTATERQALSIEINDVTNMLRNSVRRYQGKKVYIGQLARPKMSEYENKKYTNMPAEVKEYMEVLLDAFHTTQRMLGRNPMLKDQFSDVSFVVPSIRKSGYDAMREKGFKDSAKNMLGDTFTAQETDTEFGELRKANGEPLKMIPQYFVNYVPAALVSKDLTNSIIKFADMAHRYRAKSELLGLVNLTRSAMISRSQLEMASTGDYLKDAVAKRAGIDLVDRQSSAGSNAVRQFESFIDNVFYGQSMIRKDDVIATITGKLDSNKLSQFAGTVTAVTALAGNWLQAGNQIILDSTMNAAEAWAGQYYSRADLLWARGKTYRAGFGLGLLRNIAEGLSDPFATDNKLYAMMEWADALQEFGGQFGKETGTALKKKLSLDSAFIAQHAAEFQTTAERLLALGRSYKGKFQDKSGKVILNKQGKPADMWDLFVKGENGQYNLDKRVAKLNGRKWNKSEFVGRLHGLNKKTNQLKGNVDKPLVNRYATGRLMMFFRNYFVPGYRKRFGFGSGGIHTDIESGQVIEGYYQTFFNVMSNAWHNKGELRSVYAGMTETEKQNMVRFMHEQGFVWMLAMLGSLVGQMLDDDDTEGYLANFMAYQALRLHSEMRAYINPIEFARILSSPSAVSTPIKNWWQLFGSTKNLGLYYLGADNEEDVFYQRRSGRFQKGDKKWTKEFLDVFPGAAGSFKSLDPAEAAKFYQLE